MIRRAFLAVLLLAAAACGGAPTDAAPRTAADRPSLDSLDTNPDTTGDGGGTLGSGTRKP